ncbi:MAG TPA: dihydropteroate synthase [Candidatus Polarisedimenticolia bacterium]|nr:dihydropteroate synthase [Candidatus Polarisedimenticolia bacterium]
MSPRAFLIRSLVPTIPLAREAEELGLYAAAAARSWRHFPHMVRVDGLTMGQLKGLRERARLLSIPVAEAMPYRSADDWSEGLVLSADTATLTTLARDVSMNYATVGRAVQGLLEALAEKTRRLQFSSSDLPLSGGHRPALMGILNVTPDSFSDGGAFVETDVAVAHARNMVEAGARIIDVGGESTRPGSLPVPAGEEISRVVPVLERLRTELPPDTILSVDTMKAEVARAAVRAGAEIINDVSGLTADPDMRAAAAELGAHVVLNHMRGTPRTMQDLPSYRHVIPEVIAGLANLAEAAQHAGIPREKILIDPGVGFGKRLADNLAILRHMAAFVSLGWPVVVGVSRKSFLGALAPPEAPQTDDGPAGARRADATLAAETFAALGGAHILRTHDPARAGAAARVAEAVCQPPGAGQAVQ